MTRNLEIKINFGISIILKYYYIFEYLLLNKIYDNIYVSIDYDLLKYYRNSSDDYYNNYIVFLKYINEFNNIIIVSTIDNNYKSISATELSQQHNIPVRFKIHKKLIKNQLDFNYDFITISTKILGIGKKIYNKFKNELIKILNNSKYVIVLLGERKISQCKEYIIHKTYSIYEDLANNLINYKDFTIEDNTKNNELCPLLNTFDIFNKSKLNIFISSGGISELIPYSSNNILGFTYNGNILNKNNYLHEKTNNINIFNNYNDFINKLRTINI